MKRWSSFVVGCTIALMGLSTNVGAQITPPTDPTVAQASTPVPTVNHSFPQPPTINAKAYLLIDVNTGQVLAEFNADMPVEPASLTKLMTAYLVFEALHTNRLRLDQTLFISNRARYIEGSRMFVEENDQVLVEDLIKGMIVQSGNDATIALAEGIGGSIENFVAMMNKKAQELGMHNTTFMNPEGLNAPGHLTTARDLATLSMRLISDFPDEYKYYALTEFTYQPKPDAKPIRQPNRNRLLAIDPSVDGLKTGHTSTAGYCLVASSAREFPNLSEKRRLLSVLLGAESDNMRTQESQKLLNWGFQAWDNIQIIAANTALVTPNVWKGSKATANLGSLKPITISIPRGMGSNLTTSATYTEPLLAPLSRGQEIGELALTLNTPTGSVHIGTYKLVVLEDVEEAGFFGRLWDSFRLAIQ